MLSLSMIVKNEEAVLGDCLESVKDFVDEIIIVDTGSTDSTVSIAKSAGARVEYLPWPGDFAPARNFALNLVKGDWVLVLDADEQLYQQCIPNLRLYMEMDDLILVNLLRYEQGSTINPYSSVSRLFRKHPKISWSRPYHSMIDDSVQTLLKTENNWRILDCPEPAIIHSGYQPDVISSSDKAIRLRHAMEAWLDEYPGDPYASSKLGSLDVSEGFIDRGIKRLKAALNNADSSSIDPSERYDLLVSLGIALAPSDLDQAISLYHQALQIQIDPRIQITAKLNLGALLLRKGAIKEAISITEGVIKNAPEVSLSWYNLGLMKRKDGDINAASLAYLKSITLNPNHAESYQNYALTKLLLGEVREARDNFLKAINLFHSQGKPDLADTLRNKIRGIVKLDELME